MFSNAPEQSPIELHRLLSNIAREGRVEQVRTGNPARCRVRTGELLTTWVRWLSLASGGAQQTRHWRAPAVGEPCLLIAPGGDLAQAVALVGLFSEDMPQASESADVERHDFSATDHWEHNRNSSALVFEIAASIVLRVGESSISITPGGIDMRSPALTHNGINVGHTHAHSGVIPGPANTGGPL